MPECDNCDSFVTPDYFRVFKDNEGRLRACQECGLRNNHWDDIARNGFSN